MPLSTVKISDKGLYRDVAVDTLPRNVRAALADLSTKNPVATIKVAQLGELYSIHLSAPANMTVEVLAVA